MAVRKLRGALYKSIRQIAGWANTTSTAITALIADATAIRAPLASVLVGSATYDPASLGDGVGATTTVTVTGAALGDFVDVSFSLDLQGITLTGYVSSTSTVSVRFQNESGGTLDLASGTIRATVRPFASWVAPAALTAVAVDTFTDEAGTPA